jgi:cell division protein FtsQ
LFALTPVRDGGPTDGRRSLPRLIDGLVLPRWLRKPARSLSRVVAGEVDYPPYAATCMTALLIAGFSIYGTILGGHMPTVVQAVTARTGFAIDEIRVSGNHETSEIDIFDRVGLDGWTSLVGFDVADARLRIEALPWVENASVRKVYPSTLEVKIAEREPFAIWQHGSRLALIEKDGAEIAPMTGMRHVALPLVVGQGAPASSAAFVARIAAHPELASRVKGYIRVSERRWNLLLENGITIKLPERGEDAAIADLLDLDREHGLLSRDIATVDMRFADRLIVRLSPEAATAREATLKQRLGKDYKPAERNI